MIENHTFVLGNNRRTDAMTLQSVNVWEKEVEIVEGVYPACPMLKEENRKSVKVWHCTEMSLVDALHWNRGGVGSLKIG